MGFLVLRFLLVFPPHFIKIAVDLIDSGSPHVMWLWLTQGHHMSCGCG